MSSLSTFRLPDDIVLDGLLPILPVRSVLSLGATNHRFHKLSGNEPLWKLKCLTDFKFSFKFLESQKSRKSGWKVIYKRLRYPKVFVWGDETHGRLGIQTTTEAFSKYKGATYPIELKFPKKVAIVELIAGGWSFHALDLQGRVFVWGCLHGEARDPRINGFSARSAITNIPLQLLLPYPVRSLSSGREHSVALDSESNIWTFISWGRPYRLVSPLLDCTSRDSTPAQVACGWTFNIVLTESGDVYIWWPFSQVLMGTYATENARMNRDENNRAYPTIDNIIPCVTWDLQHNPIRLPPLPPLPDFHHIHNGDERNDDDDTNLKVVKVACMNNVLVALTNKGHVLKFNGLINDDALRFGHWEYLPNFCEFENVRRHPVFTGNRDSGINPPPANFKINHITAQYFERFVAYTDSVILQGSIRTTPGHNAKIIPSFQNQSIVSVQLGEYHTVALTAAGKLYSWGQFRRGNLGLGVPEDLPLGAPGGYRIQQQLDRARAGPGDPPQVPEVETPAEVHFDHSEKGKKKEQFCYAVAASGWHTGALVIDMNPDSDSEDENKNDMDGRGELEAGGNLNVGPL